MDPDELLALIDRVSPYYPAGITLENLAMETGHPRRTIEAAIQAARLAGHPVITDGGVRLATTATEAFALVQWLDRRMAAQRRTRDAVEARAVVMAQTEAREAAEAVSRALEPWRGEQVEAFA